MEDRLLVNSLCRKFGIPFMSITCLVDTAELTRSLIHHCCDSHAHSIDTFRSHDANSVGEVKSAVLSYS